MKAHRQATPAEEDNADYKAGNSMVFDDALGMDHMAKYYTETSIHLVEPVTVFATSVAPGDGTLVAERLVSSTGRDFFFIRAATKRERDRFYR